eukprot:TRINITY_DN887_c0_g4_i1.p3 TRINITY_DN887_c0_g4~~TRINITY_DN887_c0_g4_i1.p3  ORF type:complete len:124 (-),score=28.86 TRINITY_DN887_c0_g4_i1:793-1164(-)
MKTGEVDAGKVLEKVKKSRWAKKWQEAFEVNREESKSQVIPEEVIDKLLLQADFLKDLPINEKAELAESKSIHEDMPKEIVKLNPNRSYANANKLGVQRKISESTHSSIWNTLFSFKISSKEL